MTVAVAEPCGRSDSTRPRRLTLWYLSLYRASLYPALAAGFLFDSPVIRAAAVCALVLALLGDWAGGVRQLIRLGGLTAIICLAPSVGPAVGGWLSTCFALPPPLVTGAGIAVFVLATLVVAGMIGRRTTRALSRHRHLHAANRIAGSLVGAVEGVMLVAVVCWLVSGLASSIETMRASLPVETPGRHRWALDRLSDLQTIVREDVAGRWLASRNPLERLPAFQSAQLAAEIASNPDLIIATDANRDAHTIADLPEVRKYVEAFQSDPAIQEALDRGDTAAIMMSSHVRAMLQDRELHRALLEHHDELLRAAARERARSGAETAVAPGYRISPGPQQYRAER